MRRFELGDAVDLRIAQIHRIVMDAVRSVRDDPIGHDSLFTSRSIDRSRNFSVHISFIDEEAFQLVDRLRYQRRIQDNRRLSHPTKLLINPFLLIPARPVVHEQLPFHQPKSLKVGLLAQIRLQIAVFISLAIRHNLHFVQEVFSLAHIFCRATGD